jgi:DNA-binding HxlR family transcriptional regulator
MTTRKTKSTTPLPGTPVRGSRTGRPIMALLDLIGRRWTLRVLWELRAEPARFEELRGRCDEMSTSVLATRLKELEDADLVELHSATGWHSTKEGLSLLRLLAPLSEWSQRWSDRLTSRKRKKRRQRG